MVYQKYGLPIWKLSTVALSLESVHSFGGKITRTEINGTPYITGMRCLVFTITFQTTLYKKPFHSNWGSNDEIELKGTSGPWKSLGSTLIPNLWPGQLMIALLMRDLKCPSAPRKIVYNTGMCCLTQVCNSYVSFCLASVNPSNIWTTFLTWDGSLKFQRFQKWESLKCGKVSKVGSFLTWLLLSSLLCLSSTKGEVWPNLRIKIQETFKSWENKMLSSSCKDSRLSNFNQWESFSEFSLKISQICFSHFYSKFPFLIDRCLHKLPKKSLYTDQVKNVTVPSFSEYLKWAPKPKGGLGVPDSWDTFRKGKLM